METDKPAITDESFEQSPELGQFAEALAAAQLEMENASKNAANPHFKSKFADLAEVINTCRGPVAKNKIARVQSVLNRDGEVGVRTMLVHASGQFVASTAWCRPQQPGPQAMGSVITYLRRYSLAGAVGLAQEDDDAESATDHGPQERTPPRLQSGKEQVAAKSAPPKEPAAPPKEDNIGPLTNLSRLLTGKPPEGCGMPKPAAAAWVKKRMGVADPNDLTIAQIQDAVILALARMTGEKEYRAKVAELAAQGRCRGDEAAA